MATVFATSPAFPCGRYGLVGRNGTGKTTLLRALSGHQIRGTPPALQILHVEQEVGGAALGFSCVL